MGMDLWAARLERALTGEETAALLALLPPRRRERLLRVSQAEKRREVLCAYGLLYLALRERWDWKELPPMAHAPLGKPYFPDAPAVEFNLSHTAGAVLVGLSDQPLGVDIERIRPVSGRAMHRLAHGETEEAFFKSWVRREARSKCGGGGIGSMLTAEPPLEEGEVFCFLETFPGYAAGVATRGSTVPGTLRTVSLDEILKTSGHIPLDVPTG